MHKVEFDGREAHIVDGASIRSRNALSDGEFRVEVTIFPRQKAFFVLRPEFSVQSFKVGLCVPIQFGGDVFLRVFDDASPLFPALEWVVSVKAADGFWSVLASVDGANHQIQVEFFVGTYEFSVGG